MSENDSASGARRSPPRPRLPLRLSALLLLGFSCFLCLSSVSRASGSEAEFSARGSEGYTDSLAYAERLSLKAREKKASSPTKLGHSVAESESAAGRGKHPRRDKHREQAGAAADEKERPSTARQQREEEAEDTEAELAEDVGAADAEQKRANAEDEVRVEDLDGPSPPMTRDYVPRISNPFFGQYSRITKGKHLIYPSGLPYVYDAVTPPSSSSASASASAPASSAQGATGRCAFFLYVHPLYPTYTNSGDPTRVPGPNGGAYESASTLWYWQLRELKRRGEHDAVVLFFPHFHPRMLSVGRRVKARSERAGAKMSTAQGVRQHAGWLASQTRAVLQWLVEATPDDGEERRRPELRGPASTESVGDLPQKTEVQPGDEEVADEDDDAGGLLRAAGLLDLQAKCREWELFFLGWGTGGLSLRAMLSLGLLLWTNKEEWLEEVLRLHAFFDRWGATRERESESSEDEAAELPNSSRRDPSLHAAFPSTKSRTLGSRPEPDASKGESEARRGSSQESQPLAADPGSEASASTAGTPDAASFEGPPAREVRVHLRTASFIGVPHGGVGSRVGKNVGIEKLGWTKWVFSFVPQGLLRLLGNTTYRQELLHVDPDRVLCSLAQEEKQNYSFAAREGSLLSYFDTVLFYGFLNTKFDFPTLSQLGLSEELLLTSEAAELLQHNLAAQSRFFFVDMRQTTLNKVDVMTSPRFAPLILDRTACGTLSPRNVYSFVLRVLEVVNGRQTPRRFLPRRYVALKGSNFYDTPDDASSWTRLLRHKRKHENAAAARFVYLHQAVRMMQHADAQDFPFDDDRHDAIAGAWFYRRA
ncbi:putative transmembrane protein [Toxoplasma gondii GAB2-2007-GAL-DOM2]|uniref:Transmembrane protein n=3 Tax=Toxoplasma gondii TaxID=5811 RepID=V4YYK1_TOXGV|nr:putative transmembrane protein [Toxoplasma gondii VEG]KFG38079.1 putative transmembrane protein [Toxoplasma gondii GAB2-2007-GAL-DOM2]KFG46389.1 putative transmembrane protein [Toxoplasma gondii p89]